MSLILTSVLMEGNLDTDTQRENNVKTQENKGHARAQGRAQNLPTP